MRPFLITLSHVSVVLADLVGVPTVPFTSSSGDFDLDRVDSIAVDVQHASSTDDNGWTLIPPKLEDFANTFAEDWKEIVGHYVPVKCEANAVNGSIFLTVGNNSDFRDAAGRWTSEAYAIEVYSTGITITGASPLGVWWGTRSLLQQAALNNGTIAQGHGVDTPGWGTRGIMLDVARHYYPPDFLTEMCNWMSFYKQNTFHVHLSDQLYDNVEIYSYERQMELYATFRPWSDDPAVAGLNKRRNESYTRQDFDRIQSTCAARGVTIIPEIEAPGHALVITQWKPELALDGHTDLLNISKPEAAATMETIWQTFLPWFHSKVVSIGADEYDDEALPKDQVAELYNTFVNTLNAYISGEANKSIRIWGTFPPQANYTNNVSRNVTIQHWAFFEDNPYHDYIQNRYNVINSDDSFYIVQKYSTSYPQELNKTRIFHGSPDGSAWAPNIFNQTNPADNPPKDSPHVVGHIAAQWNDYGPNTSTYLEAYYPWRYHLPALADKQWGGHITEKDYDAIYEILQIAAPAQNLDRRISSKSSTILEYDFTAASGPYAREGGAVVDLSGNAHQGKTDCAFTQEGLSFDASGCLVSTPLTSKGNDYTLSFTLKQMSRSPGPLFTGPDSELRSGNGSSTALMLVSAGNAFALNYSLPIEQWVDARLIGRGNRTFLSVDGDGEREFTTKIGVNGERFAWARMAVVAPLQTIGGGAWEGVMKGVKLVDHA